MENHYWNEIETAPLCEIKAMQSYRLSQMLRRVYNKVPFYKQKFDELGITPDDIKSVDDLAKLPFTYKQDLRDNYPYGLFATEMDKVVRVHASSGTTGKQTVVGYTANDLDVWGEIVARALVAAGASAKDFIHVSYGYGLFTGGLGVHFGAEKLGATAIPASTGNTKRQLQIMSDFGSSVLCCTPSYALYLAEAMEESGMSKDDISLKIGVFGAEPWTEAMRAQIEDKLGIKAYDIYGLSEIMGPGVAYDCCAQNGMHINEDHFIAEIIDPITGEVLPDGAAGELVFTCISKEALPLIRYRTRDIASLSRGKCECGRTFIKMTKPTGRSDDMLIIRGVNVFPSQIESVLLEFAEVSPHYMIIVDRINNQDMLEVQVELAEKAQFHAVRMIEELQKKLSAALNSTLGISAKVNFVSPKSIERSEGKARHVIDKRTK